MTLINLTFETGYFWDFLIQNLDPDVNPNLKLNLKLYSDSNP